MKLFQLLEHIDLYEPELAKIISWQPHGRCFLTRDIKRMEEHNVLSRFFQQKNYQYVSFRRQLDRWGFKRINKGPDYGVYYHELFLRGQPYLCRAIDQKEKDNSDEIEPPKFHSMPVSPPSFLTFVPEAIMHTEDIITLSESTQDTEQEQPMMLCTEAEYGHSHTAAHIAPPPATEPRIERYQEFSKEIG